MKVQVIFAVFLLLFSGHSYTQIQTNVPALKDVFANDFYIGCLLSYRHVGFSDDPHVPGQSEIIAPYGGELIKYHMNSMSPGNNMKTAYTVDLAASAAAYNFASAAEKDSVNTHPVVRFNGDLIAQLNWAKRQGFTFRGHTLVWHSSAPPAFFRTGYSTSNSRVTKAVMTERMDNYIHEVIRLIHENWPGLLSAIDVVNEAINDGSGTFRTSENEWYATFGDVSYVMKAFESARKYTEQYGETQIKLYYNDYNTHDANKANGIVNLLTPVFQAGYLDGIGMQEHDAINIPTVDQWVASYNKFYPICTEMTVTELDVSTGSSNPPSIVLRVQANQYAALFKCFVERSYFSGRGKIINVSKDGLNDEFTFKTDQSSSIWNAQYQCKPSFYDIVDVGIFYNKLDSLIARAGELNENDYPTGAWADFISVLNTSQNYFTHNYLPAEPVANTLISATNELNNAIENLVSSGHIVSITDRQINALPFAYIKNGNIYINNLPDKASINIYSFTGTILASRVITGNNFSFPYTAPCIIHIHSIDKNIVLKVTR